MFPQTSGYDRALTIFSPDGRLYQVEYAFETVRRGTITVGLKTERAVVLAGEERIKKLQDMSISQKIFQIDDHVAAAASGYSPDARIQVEQARIVAQSNRLIYDEPVDVETVAKKLADLNQQFTQYAGVRPFGVSLIVAGVDRNGPMVYVTDPSGTYLAYEAVAIGSGSDQVTEHLEKSYKNNMDLTQAFITAVECVYLVSEDKVGTRHIRLASVDVDMRKMRLIPSKEVEDYASQAKTRGGAARS